jgi:4-hydroxy-tetrahydrodipicolinate synthase
MVRAFHTGDRARAQEIHGQLAPAYELLKVVGNPIAIKAALNLTGHDVGGLRLPMVEATEEETEQIRSCLERLGALVAA